MSDKFDACVNNLDSVLEHLISNKYYTAINIVLEQYSQYFHNIDQILYTSVSDLDFFKILYYDPSNKFKIYDTSFDEIISSEQTDGEKISFLKNTLLRTAITKL